MSSPSQQLDHLQHWLLSAITSPSEITPSDLASTILPSHNQSATDRLAVYQHAYLARLLEVLRELFPCTRFAVGDELFDQFAAGYLAAHPPHSYTLARLADQWVEYFDASRPADWGRFVVEVARLEHAIDRIFDGPGPENFPHSRCPTTLTLRSSSRSSPASSSSPSIFPPAASIPPGRPASRHPGPTSVRSSSPSCVATISCADTS